MTTNEIITLLAILVGPILAVVVQLVSQGRKQIRDQQIVTFRTVMSVRHLPGDASYSTGINMIPIDFNGVPKVMQAHREFIESILFHPQPDDLERHVNHMITRQTKLIFEMAKHLHYNLPETDIQSSAYAARGFIERDNLMLEGWRAWPRIADALEAQIDNSETSQ